MVHHGRRGPHDIRDSVLNPEAPNFELEYWLKRRTQQMFRVKGISWRLEELPSDAEYGEAIRSLERASWQVDCILTHCAPTSIQEKLGGNYTPDQLTDFLQMIKRRCRFHYWFFGHYHRGEIIDEKYILQWEQISKFAGE